MSKTFILLLAIFSVTLCVIRRPKTYNKEKLQGCLRKVKLELNADVNYLLDLFNKGRHYLLNKKVTKMYPENSETIQKTLQKCFNDFGIYNEFVGCNLNCMDKCEDEEESKKQLCKMRCKKIMC